MSNYTRFAVPSRRLNNGVKIPTLGYGTWRLEEGSDAVSATLEAFFQGYRLIDTARIYDNEKSIGVAARSAGIPREEIFLTTKLWTNEQGHDNALRAFLGSLKRMGQSYIDLYLIHWPGYDKHKRQLSWKALEEVNKKGLAKSIGVSNYEIEHLEEMKKYAEVVPAVNQIEFHPFVYSAQKSVLDFCKKYKIAVQAYSPLSGGENLNHPAISDIAEVHHKSNAQVMLRWAFQHGTIPIPKASRPNHISENIDIFDFEIADREMNQLDSLSDE